LHYNHLLQPFYSTTCILTPFGARWWGNRTQIRTYSSNPPKSPPDSKQSIVNNEHAENYFSDADWLKLEDILNGLLLLVKSQKFDELLEALKDEPSLTPYILSRVIQAEFKASKIHEIELKEKIMEITRERDIIPDPYSITPMISLYGKVGDSEKADGLFVLMKERGIGRNVTIYNSLMKCHAGDLAKVADLYAIMIEDGIKPNVYIYSLIIDVFAKSGSIDKAIEMFDSMQTDRVTQDAFTYNTMADTNAKYNQLDKVSDMILSMKNGGVRPNVVTYNTMINALAKSGRIEKAIALFGSMTKDGIEQNKVTINTMIDAYAKSGNIERAVDMFYSMKEDGNETNEVTYNTMIDAYAKDGQMDEAIEIYLSMKSEGMEPNDYTFGALLDCYAKSGNHLYEMMYILKEAKKFSVELDIRAWNNIMDGFSRADGEKNQKKALSIWKYLSGQQSFESVGLDQVIETSSLSPCVYTLCIAINVCKIGRFMMEAHEVWMYGQENEEIALDSNVLTSYVNCLVSFGIEGADRAVELIVGGMKGEKMPKRCVKPDKKTIEHAFRNLTKHGFGSQADTLIKAVSGDIETVGMLYILYLRDVQSKADLKVYNSFIGVFSKSGMLEKAVEVFDLIESNGLIPNVVTYNTMIGAYSVHEKLDKAEEMFASIKKEGLSPDEASYTAMIYAYTNSGQMDKAVGLFVSMKKDGMKPDVRSFGALLDCYAKWGKFLYMGQMTSILNEMREASIEPDIHIWNIILDGLSRADVEPHQQKALSVWRYLSGRQSYESLGMVLPIKTSHILPDAVTLCIAFEVCKLGRFDQEAHEVWRYGQESERDMLDSNVLTFYADCLASFGEEGADRAVEMIKLGMRGENMPLKCVRPNQKTIDHAKWCLEQKGWKEHAAKLVRT
jgi:pentatricopeptide repeat protein